LTARTAVRAGLAVLAVGAAAAALGPPRFTWGNAGLLVDHPPLQGAAGLISGVLLVAAARPFRPRAAATFALAVAAVLFVHGALRLAWRLEAVAAGLNERSLAGWTRIAWADVEAVVPGASSVLVRARGGATITVSTRRFGPEETRRLERTIARRVREASSR
jgi:hypothetical protein